MAHIFENGKCRELKRADICADSCFSSVGDANIMTSKGLRFIGALRTVSRIFPISALYSIEMGSRRRRHIFVQKNGHVNNKTMAVLWLERNGDILY